MEIPATTNSIVSQFRDNGNRIFFASTHAVSGRLTLREQAA